MSRFFPRGTTRYVACPAVTDLANPTRSEIAAGTVLTGIADVKGFSIANSPVKTPDLDSRFTTSVPGEDVAADSSFTFWDDDATPPDSRAALAKDTELVIIRMPYGDVAGKRCETWPVISTGVNDQTDMSTAGQFMVGFAPNGVPVQDAVIPAES